MIESTSEGLLMSHQTHDEHDHKHSSSCGHTAIQHEDHTDYLHGGHLHHVHENHIDEHTVSASSANPTNCSGGHDCAGHQASHAHDASCGHDVVPHADHYDYLVEGHLHSKHGDHCDDHGRLQVV